MEDESSEREPRVASFAYIRVYQRLHSYGFGHQEVPRLFFVLLGPLR